MGQTQEPEENHAPTGGNRLDSWKEVAAYLKRGARTVQRWERQEGLPVHRLYHDKLGSVYAYKTELDRWWCHRAAPIESQTGRKPSIAVLPFTDMSQEKDMAYFCDGLAEEIIHALSGLGSLRVASRISSFRFPSAEAGTREIGRRLRVAMLLQGSVRKSVAHLRIAVQLVDAESGFYLWSCRYDREITDVLAIQDGIAQNIVNALAESLL